jgi:hypothetical protein
METPPGGSSVIEFQDHVTPVFRPEPSQGLLYDDLPQELPLLKRRQRVESVTQAHYFFRFLRLSGGESAG